MIKLQKRKCSFISFLFLPSHKSLYYLLLHSEHKKFHIFVPIQTHQMPNKGANSTYFGDIKEGVSSIIEGMQLTLKHFIDARERRQPMSVSKDNYFEQSTGIVTVHYPKEQIPVPDNGRYRLHNEIQDCIVCDACARVCPVDCIDIVSIKAIEDLGLCSDGTKKRLWAEKFDIDMAKCCYCGLCTTVCPTECLTMTKVYDFSEFERENLTYHFGNLSPEQAKEKKKMLEDEKIKQAQAKLSPKAETSPTTLEGGTSTASMPVTTTVSSLIAPVRKKPVFKK